jgi:hypothetical protein
MCGLDLLWESMQSNAFFAYLELVVAARTDRALQRHVARTERRLVEACTTTFRAFCSPPDATAVFADIMPSLVINLLEGAMLSKMANPRENKAERVVAAIKAIHALATGNEAPFTKPAQDGKGSTGGRKRLR